MLLGQGNAGCAKAACVNIDTVESPAAIDLEIYLASGEVLANNHTKIAAGIYAPASRRMTSPSRAGVRKHAGPARSVRADEART